MSIFKRVDVAAEFARFQTKFHQLQSILSGRDPNPNLFNFYALSSSDYNRDFVEISEDNLDSAIDEFRVALKRLAKLKGKRAVKLHRAS